MDKLNHQGIAKAIHNLEHDWRAMRDFYKSNNGYIDLASNVTMTKSSDAMVWYVWFHSEDQDDPLLKIVPAWNLGAETIAGILEAQPWMCI